jgi:hypothetical protein
VGQLLLFCLERCELALFLRPSRVAYRAQIPLFHPNARRGNNQQPRLSSTKYTHLARCQGRGTKLRGAQNIVHPRTTLPRPSFGIPSRPRRPVDVQTCQQDMPHATPEITQQITSYNHVSHNFAMISSKISCDPIPENQSQDVGAYSTLPGQYVPQVSSAHVHLVQNWLLSSCRSPKDQIWATRNNRASPPPSPKIG